MKARMLKRLRKELSGFLDEFTRSMGRLDRRGWALMYVRGLLLDGARKSVEPMAARLRTIDSAQQDGLNSTASRVCSSSSIRVRGMRGPCERRWPGLWSNGPHPVVR